MSKLENTLWVEKYRPKNLSEYVGNEDVKGKIERWIEQGDIPHLLFHGTAGTGKTTISKIIAKHLDADVLYINASDENSVDVLRDKIKGFVATSGFSRWKIVILDEADFSTQNFQAALRNLMETYSKTARFILTCNFVEKIIDPIQSRLTYFNIVPPDKKTVALKAVEILKAENIVFDPKDVIALVEQSYPDQRKVINSLQRNVIEGKLVVDQDVKMLSGYCERVLNELKQIDRPADVIFKNIRQIIADVKVRDFTELFRYLFDNMNDFVPNGKRSGVIIQLAEHQFRSNQVVDQEIQVMAMIINILMEIKE
jgi:DNA polymerase III delta prime subunit